MRLSIFSLRYGWFTEGFHTRDLKGAKALCRREPPEILAARYRKSNALCLFTP